MRKPKAYLLAFILVTLTHCQNSGDEGHADNTETENVSGYTEAEKAAAKASFYAKYMNFRCVDTITTFTGTENPSFSKEKAFGPPLGKGENTGSLDVFSFGKEKEAIFRLEAKLAQNGSGYDIVIYENGFKANENAYFIEPGFVEVSPNGTDWYGFEPVFTPDYPNVDISSEYNEPTGKSGIIGLKPVSLNYIENAIDPYGSSAGGDRFNLDNAKKIIDRSGGDPLTYTYSTTLAEDGFNYIKYVKIIDGFASNQVKTALQSDPMMSGIDIDAVCFYHTIDE